MVPFSPLLKLATTFALVQAVSATYQNIVQWEGENYSCKCYEGDNCWPSTRDWNRLNRTVDGNLLSVIPDPAVCYNTFEGKPTYNEAACNEVRERWADQNWQFERAVSNHWIFWTNTTCLPTENPDDTCTIGFLPEYVILAKTKAHIKAGVDFARTNNLRLIIRNTGHDFLGRSTGFGSLAINTHSFKDVKFIENYAGPGDWTGGAVTVGAGIQGKELWIKANQQNPPRAVVTGECPTVGFAGGYIQGGGHGPLATIHGMAADQALSFDVITADGRYETANADCNPDLYWALKGGGPGTYAAVVSVTVKTFLDTPSAGLILDINSTHHTTDETVFWKGFRAFHNLANHYTDNGMFIYYELFPLTLRIHPAVGPNMNAAQLAQVMKPLFDQLEAEGVPYSKYITEYPTFFDLYNDLFEPEWAGDNTLVGGRLMTRRDIAEHGDEIVEAKKALSRGGVIGHIVGPGVGLPVSQSAVHPAWRNASSFSITLLPLPTNATWDEKVAAEKYLTEEWDAPLRAASPYGAAYVNEGNLAEPNWQDAYWGSNYPRLKQIKKKWDPRGVFYSRTTPGTEDWSVIDYGRKLCKKL